MKDNFNLTGFLKGNKLLNENIGGYVDIKPVNEEMGTAMEDLKKPSKVYTDDWVRSAIESKLGSWTFDYDYMSGVYMWTHDDIDPEDLVVYATPGFDGEEGIAGEVNLGFGDRVVDQEVFGDASYPDFESYAAAVKPYLDKVEDKYNDGEYAEDIESTYKRGVSLKREEIGTAMEEDDTEDFGTTDDRIMGLGGDRLLAAAQFLIDDGFELEDLMDFLRNKLA
jgi:hypothetical protein